MARRAENFQEQLIHRAVLDELEAKEGRRLDLKRVAARTGVSVETLSGRRGGSGRFVSDACVWRAEKFTRDLEALDLTRIVSVRAQFELVWAELLDVTVVIEWQRIAIGSRLVPWIQSAPVRRDIVDWLLADTLALLAGSAGRSSHDVALQLRECAWAMIRMPDAYWTDFSRSESEPELDPDNDPFAEVPLFGRPQRYRYH